MSSNVFGEDSLATRASRHAAGDVVSACETVDGGVMLRAENALASLSWKAMEDKKRRGEQVKRIVCDSTNFGLLTLIDIRSRPANLTPRTRNSCLTACRPASMNCKVKTFCWLDAKFASAGTSDCY